MAGPSFYQRPISSFRPSQGGGAGVGRLIFTGNPASTIENRYVVGATVGAQSIAVRRALQRRAKKAEPFSTGQAKSQLASGEARGYRGFPSRRGPSVGTAPPASRRCSCDRCGSG